MAYVVYPILVRNSAVHGQVLVSMDMDVQFSARPHISLSYVGITNFISHLRLEVLEIKALLQHLLYQFDGVGQAVLRQQGIEDLHRLLVPSTVLFIFLLWRLEGGSVINA